ncbi:MAG: SMC family ATPase, partial [Bdellovibrionota bacterium]
MRPLRLRMSAFGPFPGSVEIDFRALGPDGLFLIHGATGAGKTSILDGLSFALFGRASGSDRSPDGMRSDLASDDITTEAILEFAIGGTVYRARRQPRQSIKKKRGEGLREVKPDGSLEKLSGGGLDSDLDNGTWELIESGEKKTDAAINELLGMSEDQFRQVVVLPQGQFRKFLSASSDEREKLLEI